MRSLASSSLARGVPTKQSIEHKLASMVGGGKKVVELSVGCGGSTTMVDSEVGRVVRLNLHD
jgi:hypothetical protein